MAQSQDDMMGFTTIKIKNETRDKLLTLGKMGDSYDAVINRLLEEHFKKREKK